MKSAVESSYSFGLDGFDQKQDEKLALELLCGRIKHNKQGRAKTIYPDGERELQARYALSRLLRHYLMDSRAMGGDGLVLHQLSRLLVDDKYMRRRVEFKLRRGAQPDIAADFQVGQWVEIRKKDYGWSVEDAVVEAMEVFGYEDRSAIFRAMARVKDKLGDEAYLHLERVAKNP
jgi:hypothetical protein